MAKNKDPDSSEKKKRGTSAKKGAARGGRAGTAATKSGGAAKKSSAAAKKRGLAAKKSGAAAKKGGAAAKKGAAPKKTGRRASERSAPGPTLSLETLVSRGSLIEKSKSPLAYLLDKSKPANQGEIWLCWPDGSILIDNIVGSPEFIVLVEKSKVGP